MSSIAHFLTQLFVSERKQIVLMADENLKFSSPLRNKLLRNGDKYEKCVCGVDDQKGIMDE